MTQKQREHWQEVNDAIADAADDPRHFLDIAAAIYEDCSAGILEIDGMTPLELDETAEKYAKQTRNA